MSNPLPERLVTVYNPYSTQYHKFLDYFDYLKNECKALGIDYRAINTETNQHDMDESLLQNVEDHNAVVSVSGDGGNSSVLESALKHPLKPPVLAVHGGNANDIANMLNSRAYIKNNIADILTQTPINELYPILAETTASDGSVARHKSFGYFGIGLSGELASLYDNAQTRQFLNRTQKLGGHAVRSLSELFIAIKEIPKLDTITVTDNRGSRNIAEINIMNGPEEAKRRWFPTDLFVKKLAIIEIEKPNLPNGLFAITKAVMGRVVWLEDGESYAVTLESDAMAQTDGQPIKLESDTSVRLGVDNDYVNVYSSKN